LLCIPSVFPAVHPAVISYSYELLSAHAKGHVALFERALSRRFGEDVPISATADEGTSFEVAASGNNSLWCVRYAPTAGSEVVGNRQATAGLVKVSSTATCRQCQVSLPRVALAALLRLTSSPSPRLQWLKLRKLKALAAKAKTKGKGHFSSSRYRSDSDEEEDSDEDFVWQAGRGGAQQRSYEIDARCRIVLVSGPVGVGKTAAIAAALKECGYLSLEVNASEKRTGKSVTLRFGEVRESRSPCGQLSTATCHTPPIDSSAPQTDLLALRSFLPQATESHAVDGMLSRTASDSAAAAKVHTDPSLPPSRPALPPPLL